MKVASMCSRLLHVKFKMKNEYDRSSSSITKKDNSVWRMAYKNEPEARGRIGYEPAYFVSHFGHLASLVWAKLILGRFRDAVFTDFSRFPAGSDDCLNALFTDPRHGRYCGRYVPGSYDLRACLLFAI